MKMKRAVIVATIVIAAAALMPNRRSGAVVASKESSPKQTSVSAASPEEAGRYIVRTGGCNDCHTPGFMVMGEKVPEAEWLIGNPIGFKGPWGTTYPQNLRRFVQPFTAEQFVEVVRTRKDRPPMPWSQLHAMSDADLKAVYAYLKHLGAMHGLAQPASDWVPPDREPKTPFILMVPQAPTTPAAPAETKAPAPPQAR